MFRSAVVSLIVLFLAGFGAFVAQFNVSPGHVSDFLRVVKIIANPHLPSQQFDLPVTDSTLLDKVKSTVVLIDKVQNCEHVVLVPEDGFAILSCDPGRDVLNPIMSVFGRSDIPGSMYIYDYKESSGVPLDDASRLVQIQIDAEDDAASLSNPFHPLGFDYDHTSRRLFVIDRSDYQPGHGPYIHVFTLDHKRHMARLETSLTDPTLLRAPNSIAAWNADEFFVTNDHAIRIGAPPTMGEANALDYAMDTLHWYKSRIVYALETYLGLPGGSVTYVRVSTKEMKTAVPDIPFANGVAILRDLSQTERSEKCGRASDKNKKAFPPVLAVASTTLAQLQLYSLEKFTSSEPGDRSAPVGPYDRVNVPFFIDNLAIDQCTGHVFMGGHADLASFRKVSVGVGSQSPVVDPNISAATKFDFVSQSSGSVLRLDLSDHLPSSTGKEQEEEKEGESKEAKLEVVYDDAAPGAVKYGSVTTGAWDSKHGVGLVSSLYSPGILVWRHADDS